VALKYPKHGNYDRLKIGTMPIYRRKGGFMRSILENMKYLVMVAVLALLVAAFAAFGWGVFKTGDIIIKLVSNQTTAPIVLFIELIDIFMVATSLVIFSMALYELFVGKLNLPDWLIILNLQQLKEMLASLIILILAIKFLSEFAVSKDGGNILAKGLGAAVVIAALIAFEYLGHQQQQDPPPGGDKH
jgi:uncharacterized membrane protein YqhA